MSKNQILDGHGAPLVLRGGQIPSEFNVSWKGGGSIPSVLNPAAFAAMRAWRMNVLRLPISAYFYQDAGYMALLDKVVAEANQAGLYVILANFEDATAGGGTGVLDTQGLTFWKFIAAHYATNPFVLYDPINEPQNASYAEWLNGAGAVVGMQQVVSAIRAAGGTQLVVAEAIDVPSTTFFEGFSSYVNDTQIVYSAHIYFKDAKERTAAGWDAYFGTLSTQYPVLIGEWAMLPNAYYPIFCSGLDATSGTQLVESFLTYMDARAIHWTAWDFKAPNLIQDETSFAPTVMTVPWCCGQGPVCSAGMGSLVQAFLATKC